MEDPTKATMNKAILDALSAPFAWEEVEWRAQTVTKEGDKALALAYIDARSVIRRLNETVGIERWRKSYSFSPDGKKTICRLELLLEIGEELVWVGKEDGAGDTDIEAEKGALSDAFKRAAVMWGIGLYLYEMPPLWMPCRSYDSGGKKRWSSWTVDPTVYAKNAIKGQANPDAKPTPKSNAGGSSANAGGGERNVGSKSANVGGSSANAGGEQEREGYQHIAPQTQEGWSQAITDLRTVIKEHFALDKKPKAEELQTHYILDSPSFAAFRRLRAVSPYQWSTQDVRGLIDVYRHLDPFEGDGGATRAA